MNKTRLISSAIFLAFLAGAAEVINPSPVRVTARLTYRTVLREDASLEHPSGAEKKQYFKVFEQHAINYTFQGKALAVTNEIPTDRIIIKEMIRTSAGWIEKPKQ